MNGYRNGNRYLTVLFAALLALAAVAVVASEGSDAENVDFTNMRESGFIENKTGTLTIPIVNVGIAQDVTVTIKEESRTIATQVFSVPEGTSEIGVSFSLGSGTHTLNINVHFENYGTDFYNQHTTVVNDDIWANVGTYIAIVIVAIIVIIILVVYMRARPNNKPTTTFTQLEEEKKAAANKPAESKAPSKTEKIKYTSSRRK